MRFGWSIPLPGPFRIGGTGVAELVRAGSRYFTGPTRTGESAPTTTVARIRPTRVRFASYGGELVSSGRTPRAYA